MIISDNTCAVSYVILQGGIYLYQLVDWYFAAFCVVVISFLECFLVSWVYGKYTVKLSEKNQMASHENVLNEIEYTNMQNSEVRL